MRCYGSSGVTLLTTDHRSLITVFVLIYDYRKQLLIQFYSSSAIAASILSKPFSMFDMAMA